MAKFGGGRHRTVQKKHKLALRRLTELEIEDELNDSWTYDDDDSVESQYGSSSENIHPPPSLSIRDFIVPDSFKVVSSHHKKPTMDEGNKGQLQFDVQTTSVSFQKIEDRELDTSISTRSSMEYVDVERPENDVSFQPLYRCCDLDDEDGQYRSDLKSTYQDLHFSRLGKAIRGSIKVSCKGPRVVFLIIWSVDGDTYHIHTVPAVNCSGCESDVVIQVANKITHILRNQFTMSFYDQQEEEILFRLLTDFMTQQQSKICKLCCDELSEVRLLAPLEKALRKTNIDIERTLDYFDTFNTNEFHGFHDLKVYNEGDDKEDDWVTLTEADDVCPICFDPFENNDVYLRTCGHRACVSCWRGLIKSSSSSGETCISCPAFKCNEKLTIRDIAHILFDDSEGISSVDVNTLINLIKFNIDASLVSHAKFCSTPSCTKMFPMRQSVLDSDESQPGMSVYLCSCGTSMCNDCYQPAHFGMSCSDYERVTKEMDSGRIDAEYKSLLWCSKNTSPCPKCKFPINKNGGCNHVWCGKCHHYFCWVCGGNGSNCGSYICKSKELVTFGREIPSYSDDSNVLSNQVDIIRELFQSKSQFENCLKKGSACHINNNRQGQHEMQLLQMIVWMRGYDFVKMLLGNNRNKEAVEIANSLQVTLNTLSLDENYSDMAFKSEESMIKPTKRTYTKKKILRSNQYYKHMSMLQNKSEQTLPLSDTILISKIQAMDGRRLSIHISTLMERVMNKLITKNKKLKKRSSKIIDAQGKVLLNNKMKAQKAPWRGEGRFTEDSTVTTVTATDFMKRKNNSKATARQSWKGKVIVKARRHHVLNFQGC